jgi:hypothetical protein
MNERYAKIVLPAMERVRAMIPDKQNLPKELA